MRNLAERFIIATAFSFLCVAGLAHCTVQVSDSEFGDRDLDATPLPSACTKDDAGTAFDPCQCATSSPMFDHECSPTQPCPDELDCIYKPGCDNPKGRCLAWARCADALLLEAPMCSCDGILRHSRTEPWAFADDAGRFGLAGNSCGADAGGD